MTEVVFRAPGKDELFSVRHAEANVLIQAPERLSYDTFLRQITYIHEGRCTRVSKVIANLLWRRVFHEPSGQ